MGIPLIEQQRLAGVAVDAVFDSVSVATTFKDKLEGMGITFCSFSEAVGKYPELIKKYLALGKAVMGIRTSSHAFEPKGKLSSRMTTWPTFDIDVFGGDYHGHYNRDQHLKMQKNNVYLD